MYNVGNSEVCTGILTTVLFVIIKDLKQPKCPSIEVFLEEKGILCSIKKNEVALFILKWKISKMHCSVKKAKCRIACYFY